MEATERFSNRVENYVKYRPQYPQEIIPFFEGTIGLSSDSIIADIGSGTGFSAEMFLKNGNAVYGVEPNKEMRDAGAKLLQQYSAFFSTAGTAEATTLEHSSIDIIIAGQAFHWFDIKKAKVEFRRILKPGGWVALIWNERKLDASPFLSSYENLLHAFGTDYAEVQHRNVKRGILELFGNENCVLKTFPNAQSFDFEGLKGRLLSSSYTPTPDSPKYEPMLTELERIFQAYKTDGKVDILYSTEVYYGRL